MANSQWSFSCGPLLFFCRRGRDVHFSVQIKQLFQSLRIVSKTASDVDTLQNFVVPLMGLTQVIGHGLGIIKVSNGGRELMFACQEDILGTAGEISLVLLGQRRNWKCVPTERVGVTVSR